MTVGRLRQEMGHKEFVEWDMWHQLQNQRQELETLKRAAKGPEPKKAN
jgi:hypothetical protein